MVPSPLTSYTIAAPIRSVLPQPSQAYSAVVTSKEKTSPRVPAAALPSSLSSSSIALSNLPSLRSVRSSPLRGRAPALPARTLPPPRTASDRTRKREEYLPEATPPPQASGRRCACRNRSNPPVECASGCGSPPANRPVVRDPPAPCGTPASFRFTTVSLAVLPRIPKAGRGARRHLQACEHVHVDDHRGDVRDLALREVFGQSPMVGLETIPARGVGLQCERLRVCQSGLLSLRKQGGFPPGAQGVDPGSGNPQISRGLSVQVHAKGAVIEMRNSQTQELG